MIRIKDLPPLNKEELLKLQREIEEVWANKKSFISDGITTTYLEEDHNFFKPTIVSGEVVGWESSYVEPTTITRDFG